LKKTLILVSLSRCWSKQEV